MSVTNRKLAVISTLIASHRTRLAARPPPWSRLPASATRPMAAAAGVKNDLAISQDPLRTNEQYKHGQGEHRDGGPGGVEVVPAQALDDRDQDAAQDGAGNAAQAADHDGDEAADEIVVADDRAGYRDRRQQDRGDRREQGR